MGIRRSVILKDTLLPKGYIRGPFGSALKRGDMLEKGIPVYEQQHAIYDVRNFRFYISTKKFEAMKRFAVQPGDLIISCSGTVGKVSKIQKDDPIGIISQALLLLRVNKAIIDADYLKYFFLSREGYNAIVSRSSGSVQVNISKREVIEQIPIQLPELEEQKKIVAILATIDEKIKINQMINDNLQQQAAAIFRSWFVDYAPFGGTAPNEWKNVTLEEITALVSRGITPKYADDADQIVINQKCIRNHMIDLSLARSHKPKVINDKWLRFGDLLINSTGDGTLGRVAQVWFQPHNLTVDSHVTIVRPAAENTIFYIGLWGIQHEKEIESLHTGSTGQTELPRDRVKALELLLPDKETLDRFNALIAPMAADIISNQEENNRLASIRDALLPKLMSGKIDVSGIQL